jgi:hypothetical protein
VPLYQDAEDKIRVNLTTLQSGDRAHLTAIGYLTDSQFYELNLQRAKFDLHLLEQNEIIFIGRHLYNSRAKDGYTIEDMIDQIASALSVGSVVDISKTWSRIDNLTPRADRYGNAVMDRGVFEMTAKKPRAELFSVMPKGDNNKPSNIKKPT